MPVRPSAEAALAEDIDTSAFEGLVGYHARRAALAIIDVFVRDMAVYDLRPVAFSILLLVDNNPGITSAQLCSQLNIQSSNLVGLIKELLQRQLIERRPHPNDGRAMGLHLSEAGQALTRQAARTAAQSELQATARLSDAERQTVVRLLQKIYR